MLTENMKKAIKAVEADEELKAKIEALEGADDAVAQAIAIRAEHGCTLTEEDFAVLTDEDFQETGNAALSLDDLDSVAGGAPTGLRWIVRDMRFQDQLRQARNR